MEFDVCAQCSVEIQDKGIFFRKKHFCSDECCEAFEELYLKKGEPKLEELDKEDLDESENLEFDEDEDFEKEDGDDLLDDDFKIDPDDF